MNNKLLLFDIDGVLIKEGISLLDRRWNVAIDKVFGINSGNKLAAGSGMTDGLILLETGKLLGISAEEIKKNQKELFSSMVAYVEENIQNANVEILPGVEDLLKALKEKRYLLGLLTGNLEPIAKMKLDKVNVYQFFDVGGFGNSFGSRSSLIYTAIEKAEKKLEIRISKSDVFYFGDSPRDIRAGNEAGVNTIGVTTGGYDKKDLDNEGSTTTFKDLKDAKAIMGFIENKNIK